MKALLALIFIVLNGNAYARTTHTQLSFANGDIHAHITWMVGPKQVPDESKMRIDWRNGRDHSAIDAPGVFTVRPMMNMNGHQHGTSPVTITGINEAGKPVLGAYEISKIYFTMGGKWEIRVTVNFPNGQSEMQKFEYDFGGGGHRH